MKIAIFITATGQILRVVEAPVGSATLQLAAGEDWIPAENETDETHYVDTSTLTLVAIPPRQTQFHTWDPATRAWVPNVPAAKSVRVNDLLAEYRRRKDLQLVYDAKALDAGLEAREQLVFKAFEFAERARLAQPATGASRVWENADGSFYTFAADGPFRNWLGGFVIALSDRTAQQRLALRQHVQNIRALTTVEDILAYDITVGWPA